jgi:hypothetical protein
MNNTMYNAVKTSKVSYYGEHIVDIEDFDVNNFDILQDGSSILLLPLDGNALDIGEEFNGIEYRTTDCYTEFEGRQVLLSDASTGHAGILIHDVEYDSEELTVSIWIYPFSHAGGWANVFHLTPNGRDCCTYNDRQPAMFLYSNDNRRLHPRNDSTYRYNDGIDRSYQMINYGVWQNLVISMTKNRMDIFVNGILRQTYNSPGIFKRNNGDMYLCDPWYTSNMMMAEFRMISRSINESDAEIIYKDGLRKIFQ